MILLVFALLLRLSVSGECQMGEVPIEETPVKRVFNTRVYSNNDLPFILKCALFILF